MRRGTTGQLLDHHPNIQIHQMERRPMLDLDRQMATDQNQVLIPGSQPGNEEPGYKELYVKIAGSGQEEMESDKI